MNSSFSVKLFIASCLFITVTGVVLADSNHANKSVAAKTKIKHLAKKATSSRHLLALNDKSSAAATASTVASAAPAAASSSTAANGSAASAPASTDSAASTSTSSSSAASGAASDTSSGASSGAATDTAASTSSGTTTESAPAAASSTATDATATTTAPMDTSSTGSSSATSTDASSASSTDTSSTESADTSKPAKGKSKSKHHSVSKDMPTAPVIQPDMLLDGFYVGAQLGYDAYLVQDNFFLNGATQNNGNPEIGNQGFVGGMFLGYSKSLTPLFHINLEAAANLSGAYQSYQINSTNGQYSFKETTNASYNISALPGIKFTNTLLGYIRLGFSWVNLQVKENTNLTPAPAQSSSTKTRHGFTYGLGFESLVYKNWSVRPEYTHTYYGQFDTSLGSSITVSDNQFMLGLIYHFS